MSDCQDCKSCECKEITLYCILCGCKVISQDQDADDLPLCDRCLDRMDD